MLQNKRRKVWCGGDARDLLEPPYTDVSEDLNALAAYLD
jgi:hypothetical protein